MKTIADSYLVSIVFACLLLLMSPLLPGCDSPVDMEAKTSCLSPVEGEEPRVVYEWKYDLVREAIEETLSANEGNPYPVDTLEVAVVDYLTLKGQPTEEIASSFTWITKVVLGDMEVRGIVERVVEDDAKFVQLK